MPRVRKDADVFVRRTYLNLQDSFVQITGEDEKLFYTISGQRETIDDYEDGDQKMVRVYFRMDPIIDTYERQVYSSGDFLAQLGGIFSFLRAIGAVLVYMFSERLLVAALAGKLYQVYDEKKEKDPYGDGGSGEAYLNQSMNQSMIANKSSNKIQDISHAADEEQRFFNNNPVRNLFKNSLYCRSKQSKLADKLKNNKELDEVDRLKMKSIVTSRSRFNYNSYHIIEFMLCCVICRQRRNRKKWRRHLLYNRAHDKVFKQLDVVNILRWIEQLKLLTKGLLNHKQKFWLKFQKEHVLEIDQNSEEERNRKRREEELEGNDLIRSLEKNDPKAKKKVDKMLKYLQHTSRTAFDQKIIAGLFDEYKSDSDEEEKVNKVMDTEEERKEFYSLSLPPDEPRKRQFNRGKGAAEKLDFTALRNLYNNKDGLTSIGIHSPKGRPPIGKSTTSMTNKKLKTKRTLMNSASPLDALSNKSPVRKKKTKNYRDKSPASSKFAAKQNKINEYEDEEEDVIGSESQTKVKSSSGKLRENVDSQLDHTKDDFLEKAEKQIESGSFNHSSFDKSKNPFLTKF